MNLFFIILIITIIAILLGIVIYFSKNNPTPTTNPPTTKPSTTQPSTSATKKVSDEMN